MKSILQLTAILILCGIYFNTFAQPTTEKLYNPEADAVADIAKAVSIAKAENKHVFLQIGGNWCPWCIKLHHFMQSNATIDSILKASYIVVKVNYSKENKNLPLMEKLGYPQRFGFPVLVILDQKGNRLHTQDSGLLESGNGYDAAKVITFLKNWTPQALDPARYKAK